jgi:xanthosine utilization system XapX-like protein
MSASGVTLGTRRAAGSEQLVRFAAIAFAVAVVLHNGDHLRRGGDSVSAQVFWLGSAAIILEVGVVALVLVRHPSAPLAAMVVGLSLAVGYIVVHFTPDRSLVSDSLVDGNAQIISMIAAALETITALALGLAGARAVREDGLASTSGDALGTAVVDGLRRPLIAAFALINVLIFVLSLAGR